MIYTFTRLLSEFEGYNAYDCEQDANDDEPLNDLRFGEPLFLIMVMDGGHEEGTILHRHGFVRRQAVFAAIEFAAPSLPDDGKVFDDVYAAQYGEQQFFADEEGENGDDAAESQRACVAHEDFGRVGVKPQKAQCGTYKGRDEDCQLANVGEVDDVEVVGHDDVAGEPCQNGQGSAYDGGCAGGKAVDTVGEIGGVGDSGHDKNCHQHVDHPDPVLRPVTHPRDEPCIVELVAFHEGDGGLCGGDAGMEGEQQSHTQSQSDLPEHFEFAGHTRFVFFKDLDVVVNETDKSQPECCDEHGDDVDVVQLGQQQCGDDYRRKDEQSSHCGRAFFLFLPFEPQIAHGLSYRLAPDETDEGFAAEKHDEQGQYGSHGRPEGDVLEHSRSGQVECLV